VYDGDFDAYILHFAEHAGELFDQLFDCIEGASPLPVAEHPYEFVETIRRFNRTPVGRYFYCAYPTQKVPEILACAANRPASAPPGGPAGGVAGTPAATPAPTPPGSTASSMASSNAVAPGRSSGDAR
jgi:hypothetical protein